MSSKLSQRDSQILSAAGFRYYGPCGCSTPGEDWKSKDQNWNVRVYPTIGHIEISTRGRVVAGGKTSELEIKLNGFKDYITSGNPYRTSVSR